jgi:hypothetical protein
VLKWREILPASFRRLRALEAPGKVAKIATSPGTSMKREFYWQL